MGQLDQAAIIQYVADTFAGVDVLSPTDGPGAGDTFFIYDPERNLAYMRGLFFEADLKHHPMTNAQYLYRLRASAKRGATRDKLRLKRGGFWRSADQHRGAAALLGSTDRARNPSGWILRFSGSGQR